MDSRERRYGTVASQRAEAIRQGHASACPQGWDEHQEWIYRGEVQGDLGLGRSGCGPRLDANNYYVVRANALEDNVVLYKTVNGVRSPLDIVGRKGGYGVKVPV